ncbi:MAG: hypothetical protein WCI17_08620 [bacterium]
MQQRRDIAAQLRPQRLQRGGRQPQAGQAVDPRQRGSRVGAAAAQAAANGNALVNVDPYPRRRAMPGLQQPRRPPGQVLLPGAQLRKINARIRIHGQLKAVTGQGQLNAVGQGHRHDHAAQIVVAVRTLPQDLQRKIDFRRSINHQNSFRRRHAPRYSTPRRRGSRSAGVLGDCRI